LVFSILKIGYLFGGGKGMIKSYVKIAWRNMTRHRGFALINVLGLTLGITCCLFISLWVGDEESVDPTPLTMPTTWRMSGVPYRK
jgi:hypothetical protein